MSGYAQVMMGGSGIPAGMATAINGGVANALTATGTVQGDAYTLTLGCNRFTTVGAGTGAILKAGAPGDEIWVWNAGANALLVYPPSGAQINAAGSNTAVSLGTNSGYILKCISATQWIAK